MVDLSFKQGDPGLCERLLESTLEHLPWLGRAVGGRAAINVRNESLIRSEMVEQPRSVPMPSL